MSTGPNNPIHGHESVDKLAQFFPDAVPVRIPVKISRPSGLTRTIWEPTTIEYGTPRELIFTCVQPLEFGERIRFENNDASLQGEAAVVAVQLMNGKTAVAARFEREIANWVVKE